MSEVTSFTEKIVPDRTNSMELVGAGFGGLTNETLHGQRAVEENVEVCDGLISSVGLISSS